MNYQQIYDAKMHLLQINANTALVIGSLCLIVALVCAAINAIQKSWDDSPIKTVAALCSGLIGLILTRSAIYEKTFAEEIVRAEMTDYRLVEIVQTSGKLEK